MRTAQLLVGLAALPALALAACAELAEPATAAATEEGRRCFRPAQVNDFRPEGDAVYLRVGARDIYRAELLGPCPDINWSQRIAIRATSGGTWICRGIDAELIVPGALGADRCPLTDIHKLSDAEVKAFRARR